MSAQRLSVRIAGIVADLHQVQPSYPGRPSVPVGEFVIEPSAKGRGGDFRCNVAMKVAPQWGIAAGRAAEQIAQHLRGAEGIESVDVAPVGFLQITLDDVALGQVAVQIVVEGSGLPTSDVGQARSLPAWNQPLEQALSEFSSRHGDVVDPEVLRYSLARHPQPARAGLDPRLLSRASDDNPAYLVRRAHARASALTRNGADLGIDLAVALANFDARQLRHPSERALLRQLAGFADLAERSVQRGQARILTNYCEQTADLFFDFVHQCPVLPVGDDLPGVGHHARLTLVSAAKIVIHDALELLGVSAPERM